MRIVQVVTRLNVGGIASYVLELSAEFVRSGHDVWLISGIPEPTEGNSLDFHQKGLRGVRHISIPRMRRSVNPVDDALALRDLHRLLRRIRPDVVHTHMSKAGLLGRVAALAARVPVRVHSLHGTVFQGHFSPAASRLFALAERGLARASSRILVDAGTVRRELLDWRIVRDDRITVVPLGFDLEPFLGAGPEEAKPVLDRIEAKPGGPIVGAVARLVPVKGIDVLLRAARLVADGRPDVMFVIAGDGELRHDLEVQIERSGLGGCVTLLGFWPDLREVYAAADVVALSSWSEGTPVALIEAAAAGRPVVATRVGGVPDVVVDGETGLLVDAGDSAQLAAAILRLVSDTASASGLGEAGRKRACDLYSIEASAAATLEAYAAMN